MLSTGYVLLTVLVAFTAALVISLERRARAELVTQNLISAQSVAQSIGSENLAPGRRSVLTAIVDQAGDRLGGRVVVVDRQGTLLADSQGATPGIDFTSPGRPEIAAALAARPTSVERRSSDLGRTILATAVPIVDELAGPPGLPEVVGAVRITQATEQVDRSVRRVVFGLVALGLAGLVAGLLLAWALAGTLSRPLVRLAWVASRLGEGKLETRTSGIGGATEIEELASSFDDMAQRMERAARAQSEFVANASHQLRTPLTGMKLRIEAAAMGTDGARRAELDAADREVDRLAATIDRLLVLSRQVETGEAPVTDLLTAATEARDRWVVRAAAAGATLSVEGTAAPARIDATDAGQILDNLLSNAIAYAPGTVEVAVIAGDRATLVVRDHGPGVPPEDRDRLVQRFSRGAGAPGAGSGLGLAIVRELVERAGGELDLGRTDGEGLEVEVRLPTPGPPDAP